MSYRDLPDKLLEQISPAAMQAYLRGRGWSSRGELGGTIAAYYSHQFPAKELVVPLRPEYADYSERVADIISDLSEVEQRARGDVLTELLRPPADVLRFSIDGPATADGTVPIDDGLRFLAGSRKALLASACSTVEPQRFYPRLQRAEAESFIGAVRMGQTELGSYVATVICPVEVQSVEDTSGQIPLLDTAQFPELRAVGFGRKVVMTLMSSVARLVNSIESERPELVLDEPQPNTPVVSANLCDALSEMRPVNEGANLRISASWALSAPAVPPAIPSRIEVSDATFPAIQGIAARLRPSAQPTEGRYVGMVDTLSGTPDEHGRMRGDVILGLIADEELIKAKITLLPEDYAAACDAHKNHQYVSVVGELHRGARLHSLRSYSRFHIVQ